MDFLPLIIPVEWSESIQHRDRPGWGCQSLCTWRSDPAQTRASTVTWRAAVQVCRLEPSGPRPASSDPGWVQGSWAKGKEQDQGLTPFLCVIDFCLHSPPDIHCINLVSFSSRKKSVFIWPVNAWETRHRVARRFLSHRQNNGLHYSTPNHWVHPIPGSVPWFPCLI